MHGQQPTFLSARCKENYVAVALLLRSSCHIVSFAVSQYIYDETKPNFESFIFSLSTLVTILVSYIKCALNSIHITIQISIGIYCRAKRNTVAKYIFKMNIVDGK